MSAPFRIKAKDRSLALVEGQVTKDEAMKEYLDRLMKLIPGEVVGLYLVGKGVIPADQATALLIWSILCLCAVFCVRVFGTSDRAAKIPVQWPTVIIACVSFVIWLYTLGGPFQAFNLHVPYIGSLLVLAWTFFVPIFYRGDRGPTS